jgi:TMEM175 potassium channel family protein
VQSRKGSSSHPRISHKSLIKAYTIAEVLTTSRRRIIVYQALYAACLLFGLVTIYAAIAALVLLQLNSAIAPRVRPLDRF